MLLYTSTTTTSYFAEKDFTYRTHDGHIEYVYKLNDINQNQNYFIDPQGEIAFRYNKSKSIILIIQ